MFALKPLSKDAIPAALAKAERYRLLNEPDQAESICEDILPPTRATGKPVVTLLLALTDRFSHAATATLVSRAQELAAAARVALRARLLRRAGRRAPGPGAARPRAAPAGCSTAGDWLREAMEHYEEAEAACARRATTTPACAGTPARAC